MIIGCYTAEMGGNGTGLVIPGGPSVETPSPSYIISQDDFLYAVNETGDGTVSSYDRHTLAVLSTVPTGGVWPCHLAYHPDGYVLVANYGSGSVSVHPVGGGVLRAYTDLVMLHGSGPRADRQDGPHAHQVVVDPSGAVTVVDLGSDRLWHYRLRGGKLIGTGQTVVPAGTGPRHFVTQPSGRRYLVGELSSQILLLDGEQVLTSVPTTGFGGSNLPSAIRLDGDLLYVANRGADTLAVFDLDLRPIAEVPCGGAWPRDLVVEGGLVHVANQHSDTVVTFTAGPSPQPTGAVFHTGSPACLLP
ncbi:lactonase family protein [Actinoplanes sp. HUAS TT8]|uniref:lactonase family protein n=1 Tax=Actinoplanes sp. HUAS TT8 TaxID=3447453 RepID=UPI003F51C817